MHRYVQVQLGWFSKSTGEQVSQGALQSFGVTESFDVVEDFCSGFGARGELAAVNQFEPEVGGFSGNADLLGQLLGLNLEVAGRIERGLEVTALGVPKVYGGEGVGDGGLH